MLSQGLNSLAPHFHPLLAAVRITRTQLTSGGERRCSIFHALQILDEVESLSISVPVDVRSGACFTDEVRQFKVGLIRAALGRTSGSQTQAARLLGLKPTTLNAKIKRYKISPNGYQVGTERNAA